MDSNIEIKAVFAGQIKVEFAGKDVYKLIEPVVIKVETCDSGVLRLQVSPGFSTDMRSGCHAIDLLIPKFTENNLYNASILTHDCAYTQDSDGEHFIAKETADLLLRDMVIFSGQLGKIRAGIMYNAVKWFGKSAYYDLPKGAWAKNGEYIKFRWNDR